MKKRRMHTKTLAALLLATSVLMGCGSLFGNGDGITDGGAPGPEILTPAEPDEGYTNGDASPAGGSGTLESEWYKRDNALTSTECLPYDMPYATESYEKAPENGFFVTQSSPLSTFSASVNTASYANVRRMIEDGYRLSDIYPDAVRAEEFVNYFQYDLNAPKRGEKFGMTMEMAACPWNEAHKLLFVGMRTEAIDMSGRPDSNLVFLVDVSGSMYSDDKLPLLVRSFKQLTENLTERDRVSIVTYASGVSTVLDSVPGNEKNVICDALDALEAAGSTNGEGGIQRAYELAERNFTEQGENRVILATDGDLNVGISDPDGLQRLIEEKKDSGIYLSVLGFGTGNYKDDNLERLARCGNGNYAYIDSLLEAKKVLVAEMGATLHTVADDVKLQIEFNPAKVNAYRLVGYENRMLEATDFHDDTKDAGEIGAGHCVVALYEIIETGSKDEITLRYGSNGEESDTAFADEYAIVRIRYKEPGEAVSSLAEHIVDERVLTDAPGEDFRFAACAAEFALILSDSAHKGTATLEHILQTCREIDTSDEYRNEFYYLVRKLSGMA